MEPQTNQDQNQQPSNQGPQPVVPVPPVIQSQPNTPYGQVNSGPSIVTPSLDVAPVPLNAGGMNPIQSSSNKFIVLLAVGLVGIGIIVGVVTLLKLSHKKTGTSQLNTYGSAITADQVAKLNPTNTFFTVFGRAAEQSVVTTTSSYYFSDTPNDYSQQGDKRQVTFDYASKKFSFESNTASLTGSNSVDEQRCVGGQEYDYLSDFSDQGWQKSDSNTDCALESLSLEGLNDGLNTGGLSSTAADKFIQGLRKQSGLVTVNSLKLAQQSGKSLLRFDVTVQPVKASGYGYLGLQYFTWAFKDTGENPVTWPYTYIGAAADGIRLAYYVDPGTQLPVYAQMRTTTALDDQGKPATNNHQIYDYEHVEYSFGGTVPVLTLTDHNPLKLNWPTEKL